MQSWQTNEAVHQKVMEVYSALHFTRVRKVEVSFELKKVWD